MHVRRFPPLSISSPGLSAMRYSILLLVAVLCLPLINASPAAAQDGAKTVEYYGYNDCIELTNATTRVVLCPAAGGRILEYSAGGENILYLPPGNEGWTWEPNGPRDSKQRRRASMDAGRFDIGPEKMVRRGSVLWMGRWDGKITGDRKATLTSQFDESSGVRLVREFELADSGTELSCTQTIINESDKSVSLCHWSRTFARGGGVAIVPRSEHSRFPHGYVMYDDANRLLFQPEDPAIQFDDERVVIKSAPKFPKLGFDSHAGWMAYLAPGDQLFVKRFATYPGRAYNEFAGLTMSVWYPERDRVELEPIGPAETLAPRQRASFTEVWWLLNHPFSDDASSIDFAAIDKQVKSETKAPRRAGGNSIASPVVHADRSVTLQLVAPQASNVRVRVAGRTFSMDRDNTGLWSFTTNPLPAGIHDYTFQVDGASITDPRNRWVKKWLTCANMFEIPGTPPLLTEQQSVPHGTAHHEVYRSSTTKGERSVIVYTPPGYDAASDKTYPLVVLCHGFGDDQTAWTEVGRCHWIVDNLIHQGKIEPMIIAMPHGHPIPVSERLTSDDYRDRNDQLMTDDVVKDLLPFLEQNYRIGTERNDRAITGLSMGGGHSIRTALRYPESFAWIGAFSAAAPQGELNVEFPDVANRVSENPFRLFWIACGTEDFLLQRNRSFNEGLNELGIAHTYVETNGAHDWGVWRDYLPQFLQRVFR